MKFNLLILLLSVLISSCVPETIVEKTCSEVSNLDSTPPAGDNLTDQSMY
jgi:hypothetical protein